MSPAAFGKCRRDLQRLFFRHLLHQHLGDESRDLDARLVRHVGEHQKLVADVLWTLDLDHLDDRGRGHVAELRIDRAEHRVRVHHDLVGGERDQRTAAHRIVRHEYRHLALALDQRLGDLLGGEHQTPGVCRMMSIGCSGGVRRMARRMASESSMLMLPATGTPRTLALSWRWIMAMTRDLRASSMRPMAALRCFSRLRSLPPNTCRSTMRSSAVQNAARARLATCMDQGRF